MALDANAKKTKHKLGDPVEGWVKVPPTVFNVQLYRLQNVINNLICHKIHNKKNPHHY